MLYMSSTSTNDGNLSLNVTFKLGTDLDMAQVLVQNRVAIAEAKLPEDVKRQGVTTKKRSPSILLCIYLISPDNSRDQLYLSNYATTDVKDVIARLEGVGDVAFLGSRDYSMRIWVDPEKLASRNMTADDVVQALREQNIQVAAGRIGQPPIPKGIAFDYPINTLGRLIDAEEIADVVIKTGEKGQITRLKDIARVELAQKSRCQQLPRRPALHHPRRVPATGRKCPATAEEIKKEMQKLKAAFPRGIDYKIIYDTTIFIDESIHEVYKTLFEAFVLVFIVVLIFSKTGADAHAHDRRARLAHRHLLRYGASWGFLEQPLALRPRACHRHRRRRRHRRGRKHRTLDGQGPAPARGNHQGHGRNHRSRDRGVARVQALGHPALDVFDHDDGVVDHDADGKHQAEKREIVQGNPKSPSRRRCR